MLCIKCKKEIDDTSLRCKYCNTKVQTVCPVCKTKNLITAEYCSGCGLQLLKYCPSCGKVNLPDAKECRKCGHEFEDEDMVTISQLLAEAADGQIENYSESESSMKNPEPIAEINEEEDNVEVDEEMPDKTLLSLSSEIDQIEELPLSEDYTDVVELEPLEDLAELTDENCVEAHQVQDDVQSPDFAVQENLPDSQTAQEVVPQSDDEPSVQVKMPENSENTADTGINKDEKMNEDAKVIKQTGASKEKVVPAMELQMNETSTQEMTKTKIPVKQEPQTQVVPDDSQESKDEDSNLEKALNLSTNDQSKCKNVMVEAIRSDDKLIIGLSGEEGHGKSTILKYLFNDLINQNYNWLWGECSANTQISPFGIFQEMLLTFFNCPNYTTMSQDFQLSVQTAFKNYFSSFTKQDVSNLFNFLYPSLTAHFEDILVNKEITFNLLEKTLIEISKKSKLIITIDDFDMIDGASYEFLVRFIENENLSPNLKLVISYKDKRIAQGYFYSEKIKENQYQDIHLGKLDTGYIDKLVKLYLNGFNPLPEELFKEICENSKGNSAYVEQVLILLNENEAFYPEDKEIKYKSTPIELELPKTIFDVITHRIELLKKNFPMVYKTLCTAAIMGNKFNIQLLEQIMKLNSADFQNILKLLSNSAYITQFNNSLYVFKNTLLWKIIYERAKQNKDFVTLNERIFDVINTVTLSSNALKALVAQNLNQKLLALNIWTENTKLCSYLGDEHLWTLSQKQSLKIVQEVTPQNNRIIINNIYERLGKLLYSSKPAEAIEYLSYALNQAIKVSNIPKTIELSGYLSKSCSIVGNYHGVIESIDTILKLIDNPEHKLEAALIKYKKLKAMFSIGNSEEIYNLASNEIIPVIEQAISKLIPTKNIPMEIIYETWLETNLIVANALSIQGNNKCFQVLSFIDEIIEKNNVDNKNYLNRVSLAKALAYSIQGNIKKSEDLLIDISQRTANEMVEPEIISQWNFVNILNKLYKRDWVNIKEDMYSVVTFANNYNDVLVKNLLKIFLGKVLQEEGNLAKALDIYNEQVTLFAKEKIAIGALLCWYYIAKITLVTDGSDKALDIAQKALEVSKNPKISNYYFMVMYKRLIAEIFIIKGDLEAAKMYIEKALLIVKNYDMKFHKIMLYQLYAKYLEEMVLKKPKNKNTYAHNALNTYKKAIVMVKDLNMPAIEEELQKNFASFKTFCQLNAIKL